MLENYMPLMPSVENVNSYVEPFFGGGAMFIHMKKYYHMKKIIINDINISIMNIYKSIRDDYDSFIKRVIELETKYMPLKKEERKKYYFDLRHEHSYDYEKWNTTIESATLYFLMKTGFNGIFQINKNTNNRYGTPSGLLNQKKRVFDLTIIKWWNNALQDVEIRNESWENVCTLDDAFYFFDPPYRDSFADYGNSFNDDNLLELIKFANNQKQVFLANRADDDWFENHKMNLNTKIFDVTYTAGRRKKTATGHEAKKAKEILLYRIN